MSDGIESFHRKRVSEAYGVEDLPQDDSLTRTSRRNMSLCSQNFSLRQKKEALMMNSERGRHLSYDVNAKARLEEELRNLQSLFVNSQLALSNIEEKIQETQEQTENISNLIKNMNNSNFQDSKLLISDIFTEELPENSETISEFMNLFSCTKPRRRINYMSSHMFTLKF